MTDQALDAVPPVTKSPEIANAPPPGDVAGSPGAAATRQREIGGRQGLEPTRYGDWELKGRCIDF